MHCVHMDLYIHLQLHVSFVVLDPQLPAQLLFLVCYCFHSASLSPKNFENYILFLQQGKKCVLQEACVAKQYGSRKMKGFFFEKKKFGALYLVLYASINWHCILLKQDTF